MNIKGDHTVKKLLNAKVYSITSNLSIKDPMISG